MPGGFTRRQAARAGSLFRGAREGNVAVIFAIASIALVGAVGVAVDYSRLALAHTQLQDRLDAALIAGVEKQRTAQVAAAETFFDGNITGSISAPVKRSFQDEDDGLAGSATATVPTTVSSVLGFKSFDVTATGKAAKTAGGSACILVNSTTASQALLVNSGADIEAPDCEIHVRSTASPAGIINAGTTLNVKKLCFAGSSIIKNTSASLPIETNCDAATDTIGPSLPAPEALQSCKSLDQNATVFNLTPGTYCSFNFNGGTKVSLAPGFYNITGTINVNGASFTGNGVTLYFANANAQIHFNSSVVKTLTAPTSGPYKNLLLYEDPSSSSLTSYTYDSAPSDVLSGIIYLPRRNVTFNSQTNITAHSVTMVVNTLIWNNTKWNLTPGPVLLGSGGGTVMLTR